MKLISLYIENFGGLSQYSLEFSDGLTVIQEPNGFGKTTLAEFIRAMFYGFPRKAKTLDKSRRQKYTPWNGGKFGGNLVFEAGGTRYRVERTFGATPRGDSFTLIDLATNKKSTRFSEDLGLELFQLDADSFERSTYLPQLYDGSSLTTDNIRAKLGNLVEDTNDVGNFDKAMGALRTSRSGYIPYRGSGGSVAQAHGQISRLQNELEQARWLEKSLAESGETIEKMERQLEADKTEQGALHGRIRRASEAAAVAAAHKEYDRLQTRQRQTEEQLDALRARYPRGIMEPEQLQNLTEDNRALVKKRHELETLHAPSEDAALSELEGYFAAEAPTEEELLAQRQNLARIQTLQQENVRLAAAGTETPPKKTNPIPAVLLLVFGILGTALGVVLLVRQNYLPGGISLSVGIGALIGAIFLCVRLMVSRELGEKAAIRAEQLRIESNKAEIAALEQLVREFTIRYTGTEPLSDALHEIRRSREEYHALILKRAAREEKRQQLEAEAAQLENKLRGALGEGDFEQVILDQRLAGAQFRQLAEAQRELQKEKAAFEDANAKALAASVEETDADLPQLQQRQEQLNFGITELTERLLRQRQKHQQLQTQIDRIPTIQDELEQWQEKKAADQKKAQLLDDTMDFLEKAREKLQNSYLGPIRSSFNGYMEQLLGERGEKILLTPDLEVQLERYGQARELAFFSAGQTDAVMLCMRLALVDALFPEVKPFVILDDPFVNLDDGRTAQALDMLRRLSQDRQIIYLVCNSSRSL